MTQQLTQEQVNFLNNQREKYLDFRDFISKSFGPAIIENIKEIRETVRNLSITSGAIGALALSLLDKEIVKNKPLAFIALGLFLFVVWEGFFYLKHILEKENNQLAKRSDSLNKAIDNIRDQIDKILKENSQEELTKFMDNIKELEEVINEEDGNDWFSRNIGDLTLTPFTIATVLIVLSFINMGNLKIIYLVFAVIVTLFYTLFGPEASFHNTYKKEKPKLFDRWKDKRFFWNIHQSFVYLIGSTVGFVSLYILTFVLGINKPSEYSVTHLLLFLIGISGIMGYLPRIFFGSTFGKS